MANVSLVAEGARSPQWSKEVEHQRKVGLGSVADVTAPIGLVYATSDADLNGPACVFRGRWDCWAPGGGHPPK